MLKDDVSLLLGTVSAGSITPALYLLLKDTADMDRLLRDLRVRREQYDNTLKLSDKPSRTSISRSDLEEWISDQGVSVSL